MEKLRLEQLVDSPEWKQLQALTIDLIFQTPPESPEHLEARRQAVDAVRALMGDT